MKLRDRKTGKVFIMSDINLGEYRSLSEIVDRWEDVYELEPSHKEIIAAWAKFNHATKLWCISSRGRNYRGEWREATWRLIAYQKNDKIGGSSAILEFFGDCPLETGWHNVGDLIGASNAQAD